jgi:diguanylate cyclase (GGDEF)-like protein
MDLDIPTLMTMESFVAACAGGALLVAWSQNRKVPALALWGLANVAAAVGILSMTLGSALHQPIWFILGGSLLVVAPGLMWKGARTLDAKPAPLVLALSGTLVVGLASGVPGVRDAAGSLGLATGAVYLFATAATLWLGRQERLAARWPLIVLTAVHAVVMSIGAYCTFIGTIAQFGTPPVMSWFGFIHFESIIFALGTAVFILALVKERNEAASRTAANIDSLTGIANRAAFMESGERIMERCRRESAPVSVMMFDLDRFKAVNDTYGHTVGDDVIRKFCEVAAKALRPNDVFGRLGGEEFAVVLPGSGIEAAGVRAERICASFAENCRFIGDHGVNATVSGGVSASVNGEHALSALLEYSDIALYRAKAEGRNRVMRADQPRPKGGLSNVYRVA